MFLKFPSRMFRSLVDDFQAHLTPELKRLSSDNAASRVEDIDLAVQRLAQKGIDGLG